MTEQTISIDKILATFQFNSGKYEREMVDAAIQRQTEIIPHLIRILQQMMEAPQPYEEDEDRFDHIYALMLLGHFRAVEAHSVIVDLFHLPIEILDDVFGDFITTDLPSVLTSTCGGSLLQIKSLVVDPEIGDFVRLAALQAMAYAAVDDMDLRAEVVSLFGTLFTGEEPFEDPDFWGMMASIVCELYPEEIMPVIEKAYAEDLISQFFIRYQDFEETLNAGKEATLDKLRSKWDRLSLNDLHASMEWWACFKADQELFAPSDAKDLFTSPTYAPPSPIIKPPDKVKKKKKQKRKQAKASKRKNRK